MKEMDKHLEALKQELKGEEIFTKDARDYLSRVYVPAEASATKMMTNLKKVYSNFRYKDNPKDLAKNLDWKSVRMALEYNELYLKTIRKLNAQYKTTLTKKVRELLWNKSGELNNEYIRRLGRVKNNVLMPDFFDFEFHKAGWFVHTTNNLIDGGYFYLLKKTEFTISKFCQENGFIVKLPKSHVKTIKCYIGFMVTYNTDSKRVSDIIALSSKLMNLNTFHTNDNHVCLGDMQVLTNVATDAIKSGNLEKMNQIIKDVSEMLSLVNMNSAYPPMDSMLKTETYIQDERAKKRVEMAGANRTNTSNNGEIILGDDSNEIEEDEPDESGEDEPDGSEHEHEIELNTRFTVSADSQTTTSTG